jgi:hypothetical protein
MHICSSLFTIDLSYVILGSNCSYAFYLLWLSFVSGRHMCGTVAYWPLLLTFGNVFLNDMTCLGLQHDLLNVEEMCLDMVCIGMRQGSSEIYPSLVSRELNFYFLIFSSLSNLDWTNQANPRWWL